MSNFDRLKREIRTISQVHHQSPTRIIQLSLRLLSDYFKEQQKEQQRQHYNDYMATIITKLVRVGDSKSALARKFKVSRATIYRFLKRYHKLPHHQHHQVKPTKPSQPKVTDNIGHIGNNQYFTL